MPSPSARDASPNDAWLPYVPSDSEPWNRQRVVHLHRRAAFAATWPEIERDLAEGPQRAIDRLVAPQDAMSGVTDDGDSETTSLSDFEAMARTIGDAAAGSNSPNRLKAWWVYRMLFSPDPLGERLTLMWHNHFATSNRKVQDLALMRQQNELLREHARAPFGDLLNAVVKHPAMLIWLDADANRKGQPNENLGRELLELFTLGIGNYTENDVQAAARALTGWAVINGQFSIRENRHDADDKKILGKVGPFNGDDLLALLLDQPATARHVAGRICQTLLGETPVSDAELNELADGMRQRNLDTGWAVETVLRSRRFFATDAIRSHVAGPAAWAIGCVRALELNSAPPSTLLLAEWLTRMGQDLFYPPNVGGWSEGRAWLNSQSILARANFAAAVVEGRVWHPTHVPDLWQLVQKYRPTEDVEEAIAWSLELLWGIASPAAGSEITSRVRPIDRERQLPTALALVLTRPESHLN